MYMTAMQECFPRDMLYCINIFNLSEKGILLKRMQVHLAYEDAHREKGSCDTVCIHVIRLGLSAICYS